MSTYVKPYAQYWLEIGILLGISSQKLDAIEEEFKNDPRSCCLRMFVEWVMSDPNATWKKLQGVIESISKSQGSNKSLDGTTKSGTHNSQEWFMIYYVVKTFCYSYTCSLILIIVTQFVCMRIYTHDS